MISDFDPVGAPKAPLNVLYAVEKFVTGDFKLPDMANFPWQDDKFTKAVQFHLANREAELEKHRLRFSVLREVFGPGK